MSLSYSHDTLKQSLRGKIKRYEAIALSMAISFRLEDFIESKGISKSELAKAAGVSPSYLSQVFRGNRLFNLTMLAGIANKYQIRFNMEIEEATSIKLQAKKLPKLGETIPTMIRYIPESQFKPISTDNWGNCDKAACGGSN